MYVCVYIYIYIYICIYIYIYIGIHILCACLTLYTSSMYKGCRLLLITVLCLCYCTLLLLFICYVYYRVVPRARSGVDSARGARMTRTNREVLTKCCQCCCHRCPCPCPCRCCSSPRCEFSSAAQREGCDCGRCRARPPSRPSPQPFWRPTFWGLGRSCGEGQGPGGTTFRTLLV